MGKFNRALLNKIGLGVFVAAVICLSLTGVALLGVVYSSYQAYWLGNMPFTQGSDMLRPEMDLTALPEKVELIFNGNGTQELRFLVEHSGVYVFATNHTGAGEFTIIIKELSDKPVGTGAACEDDCADYRVVTLESGEYVMQVKANGWWLIIAQRISP